MSPQSCKVHNLAIWGFPFKSSKKNEHLNVTPQRPMKYSNELILDFLKLGG